MSLIELEKLTDLEKIHLLMLNADSKNFIFIIKNMLLPFFRRRKHYLVNIYHISLITLKYFTSLFFNNIYNSRI